MGGGRRRECQGARLRRSCSTKTTLRWHCEPRPPPFLVGVRRRCFAVAYRATDNPSAGDVKTRPKQCVLIQTIRRWHRGPKRRLWVRCAVPNNERRGATSLANNEARLTVGQRRADIVTAPGSSIGSDSEGQRGTLP